MNKRIAVYQDQVQPTNTYGRKTQGLQEHNLNLESSQYAVPRKPIGKASGRWLKKEISKECLPPSEYRVTGHSGPLPLIMLLPSLLKELAMFTGAKLEPASLEGHGQKPAWTLSLKTREQNFGADIAVRKTLSSMNLEGELTLATYSDGSTGILSSWKSRDLAPLSSLNKYGSLPISPLRNGTPDSTPTPSPR